jgi:hypothetical protein
MSVGVGPIELQAFNSTERKVGSARQIFDAEPKASTRGRKRNNIRFGSYSILSRPINAALPAWVALAVRDQASLGDSGTR